VGGDRSGSIRDGTLETGRNVTLVVAQGLTKGHPNGFGGGGLSKLLERGGLFSGLKPYLIKKSDGPQEKEKKPYQENSTNWVVCPSEKKKKKTCQQKKNKVLDTWD